VRERTRGRYHAVSLGCLFGGITQDWVIQLQLFGKVDVALGAVGWVTAGGKVSDIKFLQLFAVLTERLALLCSTPGKGLWKPR